MPGLRALCQQRLADTLAASPAVGRLCDLLRVAHLLDSAPLREVGLQHLREHRAQVLCSEEWRQFATDERKIATETFYDAVAIISEAGSAAEKNV